MCFLFGSKTPLLSLHFLSFRSPNGCCNVLGGKRSMQRCWHDMRPCYKICHRTTVVVVCTGTGQGCVALELGADFHRCFFNCFSLVGRLLFNMFQLLHLCLLLQVMNTAFCFSGGWFLVSSGLVPLRKCNFEEIMCTDPPAHF